MPSAANGDQGVDKKHDLMQRGIRGWTKKRHLLQMEIREWTKNVICCKAGSGGGQKRHMLQKGILGRKKNHLL